MAVHFFLMNNITILLFYYWMIDNYYIENEKHKLASDFFISKLDMAFLFLFLR